MPGIGCNRQLHLLALILFLTTVSAAGSTPTSRPVCWQQHKRGLIPHEPVKPGPFGQLEQMETLQTCARVVAAVHQAFENRGVCYWLTQGALLGLYRHRAMLPWDSDVDLAIMEAAYPLALSALLREQEEGNYQVDAHWVAEEGVKHIRVWPRDEITGDVMYGGGFVDIFVHRYDAASGLLVHPWSSVRHQPSALFPVVQAELGAMTLWVPQDVEGHLRAEYGDSFAAPDRIFDWRTLSYKPAAPEQSQADFPLVCVTIPTHDRLPFLLKNLEYIQRQDYPNIEVVIVDDGAKPLEPLFGDMKGVTYLYLKERLSIGEKRNVAVQHCKGTIIAHWDDDDFFREHRITAQVAPIVRGEVEMTALEHHFYFFATSEEFYVVKRASSWGPHFGTFVYHRKLWDVDGIRYPDNSMAEDYAFAELGLKKGERIRIIPNTDGKHVYIRHKNTWEFDFSEYDAQVTQVPRPHFFPQQDVLFFGSAAQEVASNEPSKAPNSFPWDKITWDRPELQPGWQELQDGIADQSIPSYILSYLTTLSPSYLGYYLSPSYLSYGHPHYYPAYSPGPSSFPWTIGAYMGAVGPKYPHYSNVFTNSLSRLSSSHIGKISIGAVAVLGVICFVVTTVLVINRYRPRRERHFEGSQYFALNQMV